MKKICAWCFPKRKEKDISHGICKSCMEKMESPLWRWNPIENKFELKNAEKILTY